MLLLAGLGLTGMGYPILLYVSRDSVSPMVFVGGGITLMLLRAKSSNHTLMIYWHQFLLIALPLLLAIAAFDAGLAARFYPVAISLMAATAFGITLFTPPSLIERLARLHEPNLPDSAVSYCRRLTWVWTIWLLLNGAIAASLALAGLDDAWAAWTGLAAYLISGALFAGEWLLRRHTRSFPS